MRDRIMLAVSFCLTIYLVVGTPWILWVL